METKKANNTRNEQLTTQRKTVGAIDEQGRRQIYSS